MKLHQALGLASKMLIPGMKEHMKEEQCFGDLAKAYNFEGDSPAGVKAIEKGNHCHDSTERQEGADDTPGCPFSPHLITLHGLPGHGFQK